MAVRNPIEPSGLDVADRSPSERVAVVSADGRNLGHVKGFVVDADGRATHVVVDRRGAPGPRDLLGTRELTVPVEGVLRVGVDSITLDLTRDDVGVLPAVPLQRWALWPRRPSG
jgi:PRC-barrel domain